MASRPNQLILAPLPRGIMQTIIRVKCGLAETEPTLYGGYLDPTAYPGNWHGYVMYLAGSRTGESPRARS